MFKTRHLFLVGSLTGLALMLSGCKLPDHHDTNVQRVNEADRIDQLKAKVAQKQRLTHRLMHLQNQVTLAVNAGQFKTLAQLKAPLFDVQQQLTMVTNQIDLSNQILRHQKHRLVLDDGTVFNTWPLLKTDQSLTDHQRAHVLITRLKRYQAQQITLAEQLWDVQNHLTYALNRHDKAMVDRYQNQWDHAQQRTLPLVTKINLLTAQINKFTTDLQTHGGQIKSNRTFDDWVVFHSINARNQQLQATTTSPDVINTTTTTNHSTTGDENETTMHSTTNDDGHSTGHDSDGHATGEGHADGGGGHGE